MIANIITISRIILSSVLLFATPKTETFFFLYLLCGVSDILDGFIARKSKSESRIGEILDSVADVAFFTSAAIKLLPFVILPAWIWIWVILIAAVKAGSMIAGFVLTKNLYMPHTATNKLTGFLLFLFGFAVCYTQSIIPVILLCAFASFAAVQELRPLKNLHRSENG